MPEGSVVRGEERAAPRLDRAEEGRVTQADVGRAVSTGRETGDRSSAAKAKCRQVTVAPRHDVFDDVTLPDAGPFTLEAGSEARRRHHREKRAHFAGGDRIVGEGRELETVCDRVRAASNSVQDVKRRIPALRRETRREVDKAQSWRARVRAVPDHAL